MQMDGAYANSGGGGTTEGYSGMSPCNGIATTEKDTGPCPTQAGSNPGFPASTPMLVNDHAESDIRVEPHQPQPTDRVVQVGGQRRGLQTTNSASTSHSTAVDLALARSRPGLRGLDLQQRPLR
jgi:hypothetical protein